MPKKGEIKNRVGEKFTTNEGYEIEIIEYSGNRNCTVKFLDGTIINGKEYADLKKGKVKNPYHPSVYNVGYYGIGEYLSKIGDYHTFEYVAWHGMIERCYNKKFQEKHPTYKDCLVAEEWHNFQNFAKWLNYNYSLKGKEKWQLDKDILIKGNKIYSPENCCLVPHEINSLLIKSNKIRGSLPIGVSILNTKYGSNIRINNRERMYLGVFDTPKEAFQAYKTAKEKHIKEVAEKWKDKIDKKVYQALQEYEVEITD